MRYLKITVLVICISLTTTGCFTKYTLYNAVQSEIHSNNQGENLPVSVISGGLVNEVKRLEYRDKIATLLTKEGYEFIYLVGDEKRNFSHSFRVNVTEKTLGGAGSSLFTGLSLGIIPSIEHRDDFIIAKISLLSGAEEIDRVDFSADMDMYGGLIFVPFMFLNQNDLEVISEEIINAIKYLIKKNNLTVTILEQKVPETIDRAKSNDENSELVESFIFQIQSASIEKRIIGAKKIVRHGKIDNKKIYGIINSYIIENYKKTDNKEHSVDEIAWFCKALSTSGLEEYKETLYEVYKNSSSFTLKRHVQNSLDYIDDYAEGKKGFNSRWINQYK